MADDSQTVEITVRCAFQVVGEDIAVKCPRTWTVLRFKEHLHEVIPTKPEVACQRLIFSGSILRDEKTIGQVLEERGNPEGTKFFHVATTTPQAPAIKQRRTEAAGVPSSSLPTSSIDGNRRPPATSQEAMWQSYEAMVNLHRQQQQHSAQQQAASGDYAQALAQYYANYYAYMSAHQQAVAGHSQLGAGFPPAALQWMQAGGFAAGAAVAPGVAAGPAAAVAAAGANGQLNNQRIPGAVAAGVAVVAGGDANINGGPNVENVAAMGPAAAAAGEMEGLGNVDALERGYRLLRLFLLGIVIFMYSTFERFLMVICVIMFVLFIQMRRAQQQQMEVAARQAERERERVREEQRRERERMIQEARGNNNDGEEAAPLLPADDGEADPHMQEIRTGLQIFVSTCYSFVTTFFTSLVPENPPPVNLN